MVKLVDVACCGWWEQITGLYVRCEQLVVTHVRVDTTLNGRTTFGPFSACLLFNDLCLVNNYNLTTALMTINKSNAIWTWPK